MSDPKKRAATANGIAAFVALWIFCFFARWLLMLLGPRFAKILATKLRMLFPRNWHPQNYFSNLARHEPIALSLIAGLFGAAITGADFGFVIGAATSYFMISDLI